MSKGTDSFLENRTFHFGKITVSNGKLYDTVYKKKKKESPMKFGFLFRIYLKKVKPY